MRLDLLEGLRTGQLAARAVGTGGPAMDLKVTNRTGRNLRVVLPPGLIAAGATGQFGGGMGGMGGGMGGMGGGMMGGMGGMGGGMGGMGGGMGGMGGGMGGMGGGMGGGGMRQLVTPPMMGMSMLMPILVNLIAPGTWDMSSMSMMGGMGGMGGGMGGMGGGMMGGGMGGMGGGMGGMGGMFSVGTGGFRSVPTGDHPHADFKPLQTRDLATPLVDLNGPSPSGNIHAPARGEPLSLMDVNQAPVPAPVRNALARMADAQAPQPVAQVVLWRLASKAEWGAIEQMSRGFATPEEIALAKSLTDRLSAGEVLPAHDSGILLVDVTGKDADRVKELNEIIGSNLLLGLHTQVGSIPEAPKVPAVACEIRLNDDGRGAVVTVKSSNPKFDSWVSMGQFTLPLVQAAEGRAEPEPLKGPLIVDNLADNLLGKLVWVQVSKTSRTATAKTVYTVRVTNASPLALEGLALTGAIEHQGQKVITVPGLDLGPHEVIGLPMLFNTYKSVGLDDGVHLLAADFSGL